MKNSSFYKWELPLTVLDRFFDSGFNDLPECQAQQIKSNLFSGKFCVYEAHENYVATIDLPGDKSKKSTAKWKEQLVTLAFRKPRF